MGQELEDILIQWVLMQSMFVHLANGYGHQVHEMVDLSAVELIFQETAMFTSLHAKAMARKVNRASCGQKVLAKERVTSANGSCKGKTSKTGLSGLENSKSEKSSDTQESAQTYHTDSSFHGQFLV